MTTICVDVMGADKEPEVLLEGVAMALEDDPELEVLVAGDASVVEPFASSHSRARALVTTQVISMSEHPASAVRQKKDASIVRAAAAVRELKEEAGLIAKEVRHLYTLYPTPGYTNELLYVYEATETAEGEQVLDDGEFLNLVWMPIEEAAEKVRTGEISDAKTVVAILTWLLNHKAE